MGVALDFNRPRPKSFGPTEIIRGVTWKSPPGERHAIIGPNGAGKSTLFHLVSGLIEPSAGEVRLDGKRIDGLPAYEINRRGLSRCFQVTNIFPRLRVFENLRCATLWSLGDRYAFWTRSIGCATSARRLDGCWSTSISPRAATSRPAS